jgi:RHS repeat-associated protein
MYSEFTCNGNNMDTNYQEINYIKDLSIPKGGGSLKSIGETFKPNIFSGTGNYSISIPTSSARGYEPRLSINYNSGKGNGIFGLGFDLSLSKFSIRTEKGIPKYDGSDSFLFNGNELTLKNKESYKNSENFNIYEYLPRIEGDFSLIKYYISEDKSESYWEVITIENEKLIFGKSLNSRIYNLDNNSQIFEWLIEQSTDSKGNRIEFLYKSENNDNVPKKIETVNHSYNNKYIQLIQYGNYFDENRIEQFAFEIIFDYGEYDITNLEKGGKNPYLTSKKWDYREDSFSSYVSGFEIRTCRLCKNILIFHNFEKELGASCLVKSVSLSYLQTQKYDNITTISNAMLISSILRGYKRDGLALTDIYEIQSMPAVELKYSTFQPPKNPKFNKLKTSNNTIPGYLNNFGFQSIDLNNEGISGLLYNNENSLLYLEPKGNGEYSSPKELSAFPINKDLNISFVDLDGKGELNLRVDSFSQKGFYQKKEDFSWQNFVPFEFYPTDISNPDNEIVGLNYNGKSDVLLVTEDSLIIYPSLGKKGYKKSETLSKELDFPLIKKEYKKEYVGFANIFGDGLSHRIKITNKSVECWPNLGYGRFGKKIILDNAPYFEEDFDASRLFLTDIDGSGFIDIAYVYSNRVEIFLNQSGNSFSDKICINLPKTFTAIDKISFSDVLGNGTNCLIFTKMEPEVTHFFYNFVGEINIDNKLIQTIKPYLLNNIDNNLGSETFIEYSSSTKFYLEDKLTGSPWVTKLPFPVQVVSKIITIDKITNSRFTKSFKYHDGFYNHDERQFQGFGYVESWDTEIYDDYLINVNEQQLEINKENYVAPIYTKTWHHTGAFFNKNNISNQYKKKYFQGDIEAYDFPDSIFDNTIYSSNAQTFKEAYTALKGQVIRTEIYGLDNSEVEKNPYSVKETNVEVRLLQESKDNQFAVFMVNPSQSITYHYDRVPNDPRVEQEFNLNIDEYGNILQSTTVFLPRRDDSITGAKSYPEQLEVKGIIKQNSFVTSSNLSSENKNIWCHTSWQEQSFELIGASLTTPYFSFNDIKIQSDAALSDIIPYGISITNDMLKAKTLQWKKTLFWNEDLKRQTEYLPEGQIDTHALIHHNEIAEFTQDFIDKVYAKKLTTSTIYEKGGYFYDNTSTYWWNKGLVQYYYGLDGNDNNFYLPTSTQNSFAIDSLNTNYKQDISLCSKTTTIYDSYFFTPINVTQYAQDTVTLTKSAKIDYFSLKPKELIDENNNTTQALFDALGQVIVTSTFGTQDSIDTGAMTLYENNNTPSEYVLKNDVSFQKILDNPQDYLQGASSYFYYNLDSWSKNEQPNSSINLIRNNYYHSKDENKTPYCQIVINYSDGSGKSLEKKIKADAGLSFYFDEKGKVLKKQSNQRWQVSGRVVYNNKGKAFKSYLPYFIDCPEYIEQKNIIEVPPTITYYDALQRVIRVDTPKGFFSKVEFSPWEEKYYDENDTVKDSPFYIEFFKNYPLKPTKAQEDEKDALDKAAVFFNTPKSTLYDNVGNIFLDIEILDEMKSLTSYYKTDILKRNLESIDPRLYTSNQFNKTDYYNFKYQYTMNSGKKNEQGEIENKPIYIDSADGGIQRHFSNIFGNQLWSLSPRCYCQLISYDNLQRKTKLNIKKIVDDNPISNYDDFNLVEIFTYGDELVSTTKESLQSLNLWGKLYQLNDLSGIVINSQYSIQGEVLITSRQMTTQYEKAIDWNSTPLPTLETIIYTSTFTFDAVKRLITQNSPDGSVTTNNYNQLGQMCSILVKFSDNSIQEVVNSITYNANNQRLNVQYGNGVNTLYTYEEPTLYLSSLKSTRSNTTDTTILQDISYIYDAVGNITRTEDSTFKTVFNNNQIVTPQSDYSYDALYRLIKANGRQHPGINANTFKNNLKDGDFMQSKFSQLPSLNSTNMLENYNEIYTYDDSGNLIQKQHSAKSSSYTRDMLVEDNSNHLQNIKYDASGNMKQLNVNNSVNLFFNCCENLVKAGVIERSNELDDCDYYLYDSTEQRTKKVSQKLAQGGDLTLIEEKVYLGNYEIKRNYSVDKDQSKTLTFERQTLRIMDDKICVATIYYITKDKQNPDKQNTRTIRFQLGNNLGSVSLELDSSAKLISYEEYFPYGGTSIIAGSNQVEVAIKEYRYSGKERDDSTGLYYYGKRYYISWLGRWLKPDPAGTVDGMNLYVFVKGNPINHIDKYGLMQEEITFTHHEQAFGTTPGIWGRSNQEKRALSPRSHYARGRESFEQGKKQAQGRTGNIYLFRVSDKDQIPSKKGETYTTPGNPWTPSRSIAWVKGGIEGHGKFILTTDPTDPSVFIQSRGDHNNEPTIYAREVSELLANNYIPIVEERLSVLKNSKKYFLEQNDYLFVLVPGRQEISQGLRDSWEKASSKEIPDFTGDFYAGTEDTVQAEDLAYQFQEYAKLLREWEPFKLYGKQY